MRLLNVTTKRLISFDGEYIPRYAILSHMWGKEEDEVLFKHVAGSDNDRREGESRRGYAKLLKACEQAAKDKWEYIWIDTCCINKESSAELSEAINSMYAWYLGSEVCYAYLEDVQSDTKTGDCNAPFEIVPFEKSRWFKRGWTLQELIAPRRVVFYSNDWIDIGAKASLRDVISSVTDIRVEMITNYHPDKASVAEKISWAAKRQTTKREDIAYCLMGLLGVNMPLLYGEGNRAFGRLLEEVMKNSDDHSIFGWRTESNGYSDHSKLMGETRGMLADSPSDFLGAGNVVQSGVDGPYAPYSMSNKGLQIRLPIRPINPTEKLVGIDLADSQNIFKAILDCTYRDTNPTLWVVIYLKMVGKGRYIRIFPHWLDETQMDPNQAVADGWAVTSLVVSQVNTSNTPDTMEIISRPIYSVKILPTESGYNYKGYMHSGRSLVDGWEYDYWGRPDENMESYGPLVHVLVFNHGGIPEKHFGVVIGWYKGMFWIDIITEDEYERDLKFTSGDITKEILLLYGSRCQAIQQQHLSICVNFSTDYSVNVSGKKMSKFIHGPDHYEDGYEFTVDIRRVKASHMNSINSNFLEYLDPRSVHPNFKKEGIDWLAIFNSEVKSALDVSLLRSFGDEDTQTSRVITLFSPDGNHLVAAINRTVQIYNTMTGDVTCVPSNKPFPYLDACCVCFNPNGTTLAIGTGDGHIFLWDITKKCTRRVTSFTASYHNSEVKALKFLPASQLIMSISRSGLARILDMNDGTFQKIWYVGSKFNLALSSAAISPNNRLVAFTENYDNFIRIWDLETNQLAGALSWRKGYRDVNSKVMFTPDGKGVVSGNKALKYWHIGEYSNNIEPHVPICRDARQCIMDVGHKDPISDVAVSHDGNWIISVSRDKVQFWDSRNGAIQFMLQNRIVSSVRSFAMSPAGNIFATYTSRNRVQIWKYDNVAG